MDIVCKIRFYVLDGTQEKLIMGTKDLRSLGFLSNEGFHMSFRSEKRANKEEANDEFLANNEYLCVIEEELNAIAARNSTVAEEGISSIHIPKSEIQGKLRKKERKFMVPGIGPRLLRLISLITGAEFPGALPPPCDWTCQLRPTSDSVLLLPLTPDFTSPHRPSPSPCAERFPVSL
ncbi:hypothetical protein J8273_0820 [Carpediemonas membranifera]|uniref:Uncharacterized protein n=1 Tax=Carpediemonas membranifera TaxID=201153 RepID=A0A8J6E2I2_9EUKA|nr:hypothetical protein J8273_0820 [Carpediemonas membranifera]|eukprot:KAG9397689.1 hypothetical protein J8273_0820 [Carpediemonas membranifera]